MPTLSFFKNLFHLKPHGVNFWKISNLDGITQQVTLRNGQLIFCILVFFQACSHNFKMDPNRLSGPESLGAGKSLDLGVGNTKSFAVSSDLGAVPMTFYDEAPSTKTGYWMQFQRALTSSLDGEVSIGQDLPLFVGLKWQIIGAPETSGTANNFSLALRGRAGFTVVAGERQANDGVLREYVFSHSQTELELTSGFRISAPLMFYVGYFKGQFSMGDGFTEGIKDKVDVDGDSNGYFVGAHLNLPPFVLKSSLTYSTYESNRFDKQKSGQVAFGAGWIF